MSSYRPAPVTRPAGGAGPLQARQAPNGQMMALGTRTHPAKPSAAASSSSASSSTAHPSKIPGPYHPPSSQTASRAQATRQAPAPPRPTQPQAQQQQQQSQQRPQSRLDREKKKDYKDPPNIGLWKLGKLIGQGASGRVRLAYHTQTGQQAAVKIVPRQLLASSRMSLGEMAQKQDKLTLGIEREIVIMKLIEHPNLLGLWDVYETSKELFLVMEYVAGGELFDHLVAKGRLRPSEARAYFRQIIFGVDYCHRFNICHRDLKPENLLLDGTKKVVKVADFGMAALQPVERMLETSCGSPHYASPEIVSGKSYKGSASDIWSCGIILFALLCGRLPFDDPNISRLLNKVRDGRFEMPEGLEAGAKDLIWRMLEVNPEKRATMPEIMRHPWFTNNGVESSRNPSGPGAAMLGTEAQLHENEIDHEILKNLKSLWPEYSTRHIVKQLVTPGSNWQKTFYSLLVQHRDNHSMDDEDDESDADVDEIFSAAARDNVRPTTAAPAPVPITLGASLGITQNRQPATSIRIQEQKKPVRTELSAAPVITVKPPMVRAVTDVTPSTQSRATPQRPNAVAGPSSAAQSPTRPSPMRAHSQGVSRSPAPVGPRPAPPSPDASAKTNRAVFESSSKRSSYMPPSTPVMGAAPGADLSRRMTSPSHRAPVESVGAQLRQQDVVVTAPLAPQTTGGSSRRPVSVAAAPAIAVPQVGDADMQRFFQEIAEQLASIHAGSPILSPTILEPPAPPQQYQRSNPTRMSQDLSAQPAMRLAPSPVEAAPPTPELVHYNEEGVQFEDADEDLATYGGQSSVTSSTRSSHSAAVPPSPRTPSSPMHPASSPAAKSTPFGDSNPNSARVATRPAPGPPFASRVKANPGAPPSAYRAGSFSAASATPTTSSSTAPSPQLKQQSSFLGRRRSLLGLRKKETSPTMPSSENEAPVEQPRQMGPLQARLAQNASARPTRLQQQNPGLGLDLTTSGRGSAASGSVSPSLQSPTMPATPTASASGAAAPGVKQSWFAGLFNWKPISLSLQSTEAFPITQAETRRVLLASGSKVFIDDSEGLGTWRCSMKDHQGKTLRLRIEFSVSSSSSSSTSSPVTGRGAASVFGSPALSIPGTPMSTHSRSSGDSQSLLTAHHTGSSSCQTRVTLTLEKGNTQAFKNMFATARREWTLDFAMMPTTPAAASGHGSQSPQLGFHGMGGNVGLGMNL